MSKTDKRNLLYLPTLLNVNDILITKETYKPNKSKESKTKSSYRSDLYIPKLKKFQSDNKNPIFVSPLIKSFEMLKKTRKHDIIGTILKEKLPVINMKELNISKIMLQDNYSTDKEDSYMNNKKLQTRMKARVSPKELKRLKDLKEFYLDYNKIDNLNTKCIKDIKFNIQPRYTNIYSKSQLNLFK
jgi:hypothetical protein